MARRLLKRHTKAARRPTRDGRPIRVVIADDHPVFLEAARALLESRGLAVVGVASDGEQAVRIVTATRPDVALLDVLMPKLSGLDAARALLTSAPNTGVVLLTGSEDLGFVLEGMTLGVRGFLVKSAATDELFEAIKAAGAGATYISPAYGGDVKSAVSGERPRVAPLTTREREVLRLIAVGKTSKEIAANLRIAVKTVEGHRTRMMKKLDLHNIVSLVRYAIRKRIASV